MFKTVCDADFLASEISDNISETGEGYLICYNVPLARLGVQTYMGEEIGGDAAVGVPHKVYRLEEEVFDAKAIASFEGKPVTDDHPSQPLVTPDTHVVYAKGHAQNVRREGDLLVCDMVITDPVLIRKIKNKEKRQVSAGYRMDYHKYKDGYTQRNIRGNHIAIVDKGRAGPRITVKDSLNIKKGAKKPMNKKQAQAKMFAAFAKDASPDEIAEVLPFVNEAQDSSSKADEGGLLAFFKKWAKDNEEAPVKEEKKEVSMDERMSALEGSLKEIKDMLTPKEKKEEDDCMDSDEDSKLVEELTKKDESEEVSKDSDEEAEEKKEEEKAAHDALRQKVVRDMKPFLATLPEKYRKDAIDALMKSTRGSSFSKSYAGIKKAAASHGKKHAADSAPKDLSNVGKVIAEAYNPHYKNKAQKLDFSK